MHVVVMIKHFNHSASAGKRSTSFLFPSTGQEQNLGHGQAVKVKYGQSKILTPVANVLMVSMGVAPP